MSLKYEPSSEPLHISANHPTLDTDQVPLYDTLGPDAARYITQHWTLTPDTQVYEP